MYVLLVLNKGENAGLRLILKLHNEILKQRVTSLLDQDKKKEAIKLLISKAEVEHHLPPGRESPVRPELTLVEEA